MATNESSKFNFTDEQRQHLADAYRLILSWRQKRIFTRPSQPRSPKEIAPDPATSSAVTPCNTKDSEV